MKLTSHKSASAAAHLAGQALVEPADARIVDRIAEHAVTIKTRKGQRLTVDIEQPDTLYLVRSGLLIINAGTSSTAAGRQVMGVLYAHDIFRARDLPRLPGIGLTALMPGEVLRLRWNIFEELASRDFSITRMIMRRGGHLQARTNMHIATLTTLSGEERVKLFLLDLALRTGTRLGATLSCEMPFSRADMADYLALNADTLSRIMSRLRTSGLVTTPGRGHLIIKDVDSLAQCPFAATLRDTYGKGPTP